MNKIGLFHFVLLLFTVLFPLTQLEASVNKRALETVTANAYFVAKDTIPPVVEHTAVLNISRYHSTMIIEGTACDDEELRAVLVYYKLEGAEISTKTYTFVANAKKNAKAKVKNYHFSLDLTPYLSNIGDAEKNLYYSIIAIDNSGNYILWNGNGDLPVYGINRLRQVFPYPSVAQMHRVEIGSNAVQKVSMSGGVISLSNGNPNIGKTCVTIPPGALSGDVVITINEVNQDNARFASSSSKLYSNKPVAVYEFGPEGLSFNKPVEISLFYSDADNDGLVDGTKYREDFLKVMWWDGYEWRYIGGKVDKTNKTVSANVSHFSLYALFPAGALSDADYKPKEKIITPSTPGNNDEVLFTALDVTDIVTIYDITGRKIKTLNDGLNRWDGRDESGSIVESGLYIYQIKTKDKIISGTIVVAK